MQVCDIALQPGEMINDLHAGDTARWNITPAISGSNGNERMHILVKPLDVGLQTTLFIATDRRTYHIRLKSHRTRYMPAVGFRIPKTPPRVGGRSGQTKPGKPKLRFCPPEKTSKT